MSLLKLLVPLIFALAALAAIVFMARVLYQAVKPQINWGNRKSKIIPIRIVKTNKPADKKPDDIVFH